MIFGKDLEGECEDIILVKKQREKQEGWLPISEEELDWLEDDDDEEDEEGLNERKLEDWEEYDDDEDPWEDDYIPKYGTKYNRKQKKDS